MMSAWTDADAETAARTLTAAVRRIRRAVTARHRYRDYIEIARTQLFLLSEFHAQRFPEGDGTVRALLESEGRG